MPFTFHKNAQNATKLDDFGFGARAGDVATSTSDNPPLSSGFLKLEKVDAPLVYLHTYDEFQVVLSGEVRYEDETGAVAEAKAGDVIYFKKGTEIKFSSPSKGEVFYAAQRSAADL